VQFFSFPFTIKRPSNLPSFGRLEATKCSVSPNMVAVFSKASTKHRRTECPFAEKTANSEQKTLQIGVEEEKRASIRKGRKCPERWATEDVFIRGFMPQ